MSEEERDPLVIHDAIEKKVYTPHMEGGFNPEKVAAKISAKIEDIHQGGMKKEDFFPTFLVSEMAQDRGHKWAEEEGQFGFIYGYVYGYMLANFEKNKDTKLEFMVRDMTPEEIEETEEVKEISADDLKKLLEGADEGDIPNIDDLIGGDDIGFDPPEPWSPDNTEGYDPTK